MALSQLAWAHSKALATRPRRGLPAVEGTMSRLNSYRRLKARYERQDDVHQALLECRCALIL